MPSKKKPYGSLGTITFANEFDPWKFAEAKARVLSEHYNVVITPVSIVNAKTGEPIPRKTRSKT